VCTPVCVILSHGMTASSLAGGSPIQAKCVPGTGPVAVLQPTQVEQACADIAALCVGAAVQRLRAVLGLSDSMVSAALCA
jgi:hypothetical protein